MAYKQLAYGILIILLVAVTVAGVSASVFEVPVWEQVNSNGFDDPQAREVSAFETFSNYLYAGTHNPINDARIFRSPDGVTWTAASDPGFGSDHDTAPRAILDMTVFKGYLYASTGRGNAAQIRRTLDGVNWPPIVAAGFGDPNTVDITALIDYNGWLYAGASNIDDNNLTSGAQIWRSFTGDSNSWTQQVTPEVPAASGPSISGFAIFDGALHAAITFESDTPAQVWRSFGGDWMTIMSDGFGDSNTSMTGGMAVFAGNLYVGAGNTVDGAQLWRTNDGSIWTQAITTPAFDDANNLKVEQVFVFQNQLYVSLKNTVTGMEVWRTMNGTLWEQANLDGFGDSNNSGTNWSNATSNFRSQLYVGTLNSVDGGELWRMLPPYSVDLSPDNSLSGPAGETLAYSLGITNTGTLTDTYDLTAAGQTWLTTLSTSLVSLAPSARSTFTVTVAIPPGATDLETDAVTIMATSQGDSSKSDTAVLTSTSISAPVYGVALSGDDSLSGPAGGQVLYTLTISNTGNVVDIYDLSSSGNRWTTTMSSQVVTLPAGGSQALTITVLIPPTAADLEADAVTIMATSQGDSSKSDTSVLTSTSISAPVYSVALSGDESLSGPAGGQVFYSLTISNTGNVVDTYDLSSSGNSWTTTLSSQVVTLPAGGSQALTITVLIPPTAADQETDQVSIQAISRYDVNISDTTILITLSTGRVERIYLPSVLLNTP